MTADYFKITVYPYEVAILKMVGDIDALFVEKAFHECFQKELRYIIVDFKEVDFAPSSAVSEFIRFQKELNEKGGYIIFAEPSPKIKITFDILAFEKYFTIYETSEIALKELMTSLSKDDTSEKYTL